MTPVDALKPLGAISIFVTWSGLLFLIYRWPGNRSMSFSNHAASAKAATVFYGLLFSATLPFFYIFIDKWFVPAESLPNYFTGLVFIGCIGQLIAVWVPGTNRHKELVHNVAAYTMHTLLLPLVLILLVYGNVSVIARGITLLALIYMVSIWLIFAFIKLAKKHTLYLQASYVIMFHITILTTAYLG